MSMGKGVGYEVVVGYLKERIHGGGFVVLFSSPSADFAERRQYCGIGFQEEGSSAVRSPDGEFIVTGSDFIADLFDAEDPSGCVSLDEPIPECRTEIEAIMEILGLNEDIRIQKVGH
jgi:hypothetical protein